MDLPLKVLGHVSSEHTEALDDGWGERESRIQLTPEWAEGLRGLDTFTHAWVICWLHEAAFSKDTHLSRHPRDNHALPRVGIFAQRARHRPNPLAITPCEILRVDPTEGVLVVKGLDAIHGTPVVDIKPYVAPFDHRESDIPEWMKQIMTGYF